MSEEQGSHAGRQDAADAERERPGYAQRDGPAHAPPEDHPDPERERWRRTSRARAVAERERVESGQKLLSIEAMKMENEIRAPHAGTIERVAVQPGDRVELGDELVVIG